MTPITYDEILKRLSMTDLEENRLAVALGVDCPISVRMILSKKMRFRFSQCILIAKLLAIDRKNILSALINEYVPDLSKELIECGVEI